jgi:hypothetical protein
MYLLLIDTWGLVEAAFGEAPGKHHNSVGVTQLIAALLYQADLGQEIFDKNPEARQVNRETVTRTSLNPFKLVDAGD